MSILNTQVSGFKNYHSTNPVNINLMTWLTSDKYQKQVERIRAINDKAERDQLKAALPAITPSGIFSTRKASGLIQHSGLIQFDVDGIEDIQATKQKICSLKNVAYCGLSVSGRGLWGLIPIAEPEHHKEYFEFIQKAFAKMGIVVDPACKDVSRLRGYSYDPDAFFRHDARPLNKYIQKSAFKPFSGHIPHRLINRTGAVIDAVYRAQKGQRWATVQKAAFTAGGFNDEDTLRSILDAINSNPDFSGQEKKYLKCAHDCFEAGQIRPFPEPLPVWRPIAPKTEKRAATAFKQGTNRESPSLQTIAEKYIPDQNNFTADEIKKMLPDENLFCRVLGAGIIEQTIDPNRYYLATSTPF